MHNHINKINEARNKYKPETIECLFIAEAPPAAEDRFFYFEDVQLQDSLFLELMKALHKETIEMPADPDSEFCFTSRWGYYPLTSSIRFQKADYLNKFKDAGYFLIDCIDYPMPSNIFRTKDKIKYLEASRNLLIQKVKLLITKSTPIILISVPVFQAVAGSLKYNGYNVIHDKSIPFPGSGQQTEFHKSMDLLIHNLLK